MSDSDIPAVRKEPHHTELPVEVVGRREGMFGAKGTGDTSGFGGLTAPIALPPRASARTATASTRWPTSWRARWRSRGSTRPT